MSGLIDYNPAFIIPKLTQNTKTQIPVVNTWYTAFHLYRVKLHVFVWKHFNGEAAAKNIVIRWTVDGTVYTGTFNADSHNSEKRAYIADRYAGELDSGSERLAMMWNGLFCRDILIEWETTTAVGTTPLLTGITTFEQY